MRNFIVCGGSRGIGAAVIKRLLDEGCCVTAMSRSDISKLPEEMLCERFAYVSGDLSSSEDRKRLVEKAIETFGRIDGLVNVAGIAPRQRADLLEMSEESYDEVMNINTKGTLFLMQAVAREMIKNEPVNGIRGYICSTSSISAYTSSVNRGEYCMSKAGVSMATKLWAVRMAEYGVNVYEIRPGIIETDMTSVVKAKYDKLIAEGLTLQPRWGYPEDIARAVAAMLRGDLAYSTGQVINVDGGMSIEKL